MTLKFSIILPSYREKKLDLLINRLLKQRTPEGFQLEKIVVIGSGIDKGMQNISSKIQIIEEKYRRGKAAAINTALKKIKSDIAILQSSDTLPAENTLSHILKPLLNDDVGMVVGRPIPLNDYRTFLGFLNHLVWFLHHLIALSRPKSTEIGAFKLTFFNIPKILAADEAYIESVIYKKGLKIVYSPMAVVFNRGPRTIKDFIKQRRRIFVGHLHIKNDYGYTVSTMSTARIFKALVKYFEIKSIKNYKDFFWLILAMLLESYSRLLGTMDYFIFKKIPYMWEIIKSSR